MITPVLTPRFDPRSDLLFRGGLAVVMVGVVDVAVVLIVAKLLGL